MSNVICFASAKGGSGKTTMTATFAAVLAELGYRVLIVDCDEATNGLTLLYLNEVNDHAESHDGDRAKLDGVFDRTDHANIQPDLVVIGENITFCPATFQFDEKKQFTLEEFSNRLLDIVSALSSDFDFILLDAQAGSDPVSLAAMNKNISQLVVVVSEYDPLSAAGVERLKALAGDSLSYERTWVLLNKMLPEFVESFSEFLSVSHYLPPIPWTADVVRAYARRELALDFESGNEFTLAVIQTLRNIPIRGLRERITSWTETKAETIRQPVETQYSDLEEMLQSVVLRSRRLEEKQRQKDLFTRLSILTVIALAAAASASLFISGLTSLSTISEAEQMIKYLAILVGITTVVLSGYYFVRQSLWRSGLRESFELQKLERQRQVYETRLQELEFLRTADSTSLIERTFAKSGKSSTR